MTKKYQEISSLSHNFKNLALFNSVPITKELGLELLALNTENRPVNAGVVQRYKDSILAGDWLFSADVIKISSQGVLLDGQHRLLAVVSAGITVPMHIQTGLDPKVFTVLDTGRNRNAGDTLALAGFKYSSTAPAVVRTVVAFNTKNSINTINDIKSNKKVLEAAITMNQTLLEEACLRGKNARVRAKFLDTTLCGTLWYIEAVKGKEDDITNFIELLTTGDGLGSASNSSVFLLRNRLIANMTSMSKLTRGAIFYLMGTCYTYYCRGKVMTKLPPIKECLPTL